jgi:uncharacterized protein with HEPN domain
MISGMDFQSYLKDRKTQLAVERLMEIIGEAAGKVSPEFRNLHLELPWRQIIGQRDVLIHEYGQIKQERVRKVAHDLLQELIKVLEGFDISR